MEIIDKNDGCRMYAELFASPYELYDVCLKRKPRGFSAGDILDENFENDRPQWSGFADGKQLKEAVSSGHIDASILQPIINKVNKVHASRGSRISVIREEMGFQPDIDAVLNGEPRHMLSVKEVVQPGRTLRLFINLGAHCGISANEMNSAGMALIEAVAGMELSGRYRLELFAGDSFSDDCIYAVGIKIKSANQPMNLARMAWPIVNASAFTRGVAFGWYNRTPRHKTRYLSGYGRPWSSHSCPCRDFQKEVRKRGLTVIGISDVIRWVNNGEDIETAILNAIKEANSI